MAVATGSQHVSTFFRVPGAPLGVTELCVIANGIMGNCVHVDLELPIIRSVVDAQEILQILGSLADGPQIVIGADGHPHPVPPWGPALSARVIEAERMIARGVDELRKLGQLAAEFQLKRVQTESTQSLKVYFQPPPHESRPARRR